MQLHVNIYEKEWAIEKHLIGPEFSNEWIVESGGDILWWWLAMSVHVLVS